MSEDVLERIAEYMEVSARTAPKAAGVDSLAYEVSTEEELREIGEEMIIIGEKREDDGFIRDGNNVLDSAALLLAGTRYHDGLGLDCGGCSFKSCKNFSEAEKVQVEFRGPNCIYKLLDLGMHSVLLQRRLRSIMLIPR